MWWLYVLYNSAFSSEDLNRIRVSIKKVDYGTSTIENLRVYVHHNNEKENR